MRAPFLSRTKRATAACAIALATLAPHLATAKPSAPAKGASPAKGATAPAEVAALEKEMGALFTAGKYAEAAPIGERIVALDEKALGPDHPITADAVADLGAIYAKHGDHARAEALLLRAVAALKKAHGLDHPDTLLRLLDLGNFYKERGDLVRAEPLLVRVVTGCETAFGPDHPRVADAVFYLGQLEMARRDTARAEPLFLRSLAIREKQAGPDSLDVAKSLNDLAVIYSDGGDFARAEPLHLRALAIAEKVHGLESAALTPYLVALALTYKLGGNLSRAEPLYLRAIALREKASGPASGALVASLQNLASLYKARADYARAEPLYQRALAITEKVNGPEHPNTAIVLSSFGLFYRAVHDYARAEPLYQRALAIREKTRGPDSVEVADSVNNLGMLYSAMGDVDRAEPLLRRGLASYEKAFGPEHPKVAVALDNLGRIERERGHLDAAMALYQRALDVTEKTVGKEHPAMALALNNLALVQLAGGDVVRAEASLARALSIFEAAYGPDHPEVANALGNVVSIRIARGDAAGALPLLARATDILDRNAAPVLGSGSEEQKRVFMRALEGQTFQTVHLQAIARADPAVSQLALRTLLRRKGRVLDAMADSIATLRRSLDEADRAPLDELAAVRTKLSRALLGGASSRGPAARAEVAALSAEQEALEAQISRRSAAFRAETPLVTVEHVEAALPAGSALIETIDYRPVGLDPKEIGRLGPARYAAFVLRKGEPIRFVDLGPSRPIDAKVNALRKALSDPTSDPIPLAREVDALIFAPVAALVGDARALFLAPDGGLNLLPFGALVDEAGHYRLSRFRFTYLTSGRDLLRRGAPSSPSGPPVIIANPDFGRKPDQGATPAPGTTDRGALRGISFPPLPGTGEEARAIGKALGAEVLDRGSATEEAVKALHHPRIVHLATHGFFLPIRRTTESLAQTRGFVLDDDAPPVFGAESPLLRSGLALASINAPRSSGEDGVLTALEVAGLDLQGTRLVVLSACETALGEARDGEGVYGLRRALILSGAETQVMSLWKVDDGATRDLMVDYYRALLAGGGRSEALREVSLAMLGEKGREHPFYWASFIVSGNDASLDGTAAAPVPAPIDRGPRGCACALPAEQQAPPRPALGAALALALACARRASRRARTPWSSRPR